jgi:catechol 2,3-dioxygenase-like lactoylglutathione lyase family enzyme
VPTLRVARPTNDLDACVRFYRDALGFDVLSSFTAHAGFDGVMLGFPGAPWHLELVREHGVTAPRAPTHEHLLVLYVPDRDAWEQAVSRARAQGCVSVAPHNPYWAERGCTFEDPDGYRVVLENDAWRAAD